MVMLASKNESVIVRGELTFKPDGNGFICRELAGLPKKFEETYKPGEVQAVIDAHLAGMRRMFRLQYSSPEERKEVPEAEQYSRGGEVFDRVVASISTDGFTSFQKLFFWLGEWWYYNTTLRQGTYRNDDKFDYVAAIGQVVSRLIVPILPAQVQTALADVKPINVALKYGHFAILFSDSDRGIRRVVTDTQLLEIHDVRGYNYLDILPDGKPVTRSVGRFGGGRAFFDGVRMMFHDSFQTCAPRTVAVNGGYKVNSTRVTIVNGILFPLIDIDDKVAQTTGAFLGMCDFTTAQAIESYALSEASASRVKIEGTKVLLDGVALKPLGMFAPSRVELLDSGFSLYHPSSFDESISCRFDHVMVVDDSGDWIARFKETFGAEVSNLVALRTRSRRKALEAILTEKPQVLVLDMHLTKDEGFEGLWIANQLFERGFEGRIVLASGYPDGHLQAMATLIKGKVWIPGKNLDRIRRLLCRMEWS